MFRREFLLDATDRLRTCLSCKDRDDKCGYVLEARDVEFLMAGNCLHHWKISVENIDLLIQLKHCNGHHLNDELDSEQLPQTNQPS